MMEATARDDDEGPDYPLDDGPPVPGQHPRALPRHTVERLLAMRREGLTYLVISERLGIHWVTAWAYARAAGLTPARICLGCGRPMAGVRPVHSPHVGVCAECKPKWKTPMRFRLKE
jgi:hypothetical protein